MYMCSYTHTCMCTQSVKKVCTYVRKKRKSCVRACVCTCVRVNARTAHEHARMHTSTLMDLCVPAHVCARVRAGACKLIPKYVNARAKCVHACWRNVCIQANMHASNHVCMQWCKHACMQVGMHACMHACVHTTSLFSFRAARQAGLLVVFVGEATPSKHWVARQGRSEQKHRYNRGVMLNYKGTCLRVCMCVASTYACMRA